MSDLISRKALIKAMEKKYDIAKNTGMYPLGLSEAFIITEQIIKEQPTAYDVDKVVEQLDDYKNKVLMDFRFSADWMQATANMHEIAVKSVKGAVKDE